MTDAVDLQTLRVSLARIAQALGLSLINIPSNPPTWAFEHLVKAAETERGWNALAARIVACVQHQEDMRQAVKMDKRKASTQ
jgi:hypothetical protein